MDTYTKSRAMKALGITSSSAFHHLRKKYPLAFVVVHQGHGRGNPTLYDVKAMSNFINWRRVKAQMAKFSGNHSLLKEDGA